MLKKTLTLNLDRDVAEHQMCPPDSQLTGLWKLTEDQRVLWISLWRNYLWRESEKKKREMKFPIIVIK